MAKSIDTLVEDIYCLFTNKEEIKIKKEKNEEEIG